MKRLLNSIYNSIESPNIDAAEKGLQDLRLLIERFTMNRYDQEYQGEYADLFNDKNLLDKKLSQSDLTDLKRFIFYILINHPHLSTLAAKCLKVLFDKSIRLGISNLIELYCEKDDHTTCELIFAITNYGDFDYFKNEEILSAFRKVVHKGGSYSKEVIETEINTYRLHFEPNFQL